MVTKKELKLELPISFFLGFRWMQDLVFFNMIIIGFQCVLSYEQTGWECGRDWRKKMIIPVRCFTCGKVIWLWFCEFVLLRNYGFCFVLTDGIWFVDFLGHWEQVGQLPWSSPGWLLRRVRTIESNSIFHSFFHLQLTKHDSHIMFSIWDTVMP